MVSIFLCMLAFHATTYASICKTQIPRDAEYFQGDCKNDLAHGIGKAFVGRNYYEGEFINGKPHGKLIYNFTLERAISTDYYWYGKRVDKNEYERLLAISSQATIDWSAAERDDTIQAYNKYISNWPESSQAEVARERVYQKYFDPVLTQNSIEAYEKYINDYPGSPKSIEAKHRIWKMAFDVAKHVNTEESFSIYITRYPDSMYTYEANQEIARINRRKNAPKELTKLSSMEFCALYGHTIRNESVSPDFDFNDNATLKRFVVKEKDRRKLRINNDLVIKEKIRIGASQCDLYASWGEPNSENRSVGRWGVHIQHIYDSNYVYTENGVISSWQD